MGHGFGFFLYALAAVLTLSWVMDAAPAIARILEIGGLVLLAFLGTQMVRTPVGEDPAAGGEHRDATITGALEGFLMAFLNPKILVFQVAVLTQVLDPAHGLGIDLAIATVGGIIDGAWYAFVAVVLTGSTALEWMQRHERAGGPGLLVGACSVWPSSSVSPLRQTSTLACETCEG